MKTADVFGPEPPLIDLAEFEQWILHEDDELLVIDKPGWVVCHPSKNGPLSSLVGACREYTGADKLHLVSRLDRETSGVVVIAKTKRMAGLCQGALQRRNVRKIYYALLEGELDGPREVNKQLARDVEGPVYIKQTVRRSRTSQKAVSIFEPIETSGGYTLVRVQMLTGRKHQIRAHAQWLGHPVAGDKIYGPDPTLYLEFIEHGWTDRLENALPLRRQALHAGQITFEEPENQLTLHAPLASDMAALCRDRLGLTPDDLARLTGPEKPTTTE